MPIPVMIDTDPGIDDALAIALAVRSPELSVIAVTTTYGNSQVAVTTRNARYLLERLGARTVPVWPGAARPLLRPPAFALDTHGEEGLGYAAVPPLPPDSAAVPPLPPDSIAATDPPNQAPRAMLETLAAADEPVTLIALGPLTNVALAVALDRERCQQSLREIIWMGGSAGAPGNTTPVSEWNAWCDPEAARMVFAADIPVRMVGLDATRCVFMPAALAAELGRHPDPEVRWWADMWRFYVEFHQRSEQLEGCVMNDPLAVAILLRPELARWQPMYVAVDCGWGLTRGQTICDRFGLTGNPANAAVALEADGQATLALALERGLGVRR
ncbi:MAG: nucleoside hydrolase [Firmicutes bacterium]|nr:nucleoside hydrolase [Bacillota bacterium]